jgi:hypothetical protein
MYVQNEKNGKTNNLKVLGANQPKWTKQDSQNRFGYRTLSEIDRNFNKLHF